MKRIALYFLILIILVRIAYYAATEGFCPDRISLRPSSLVITSTPAEEPSLELLTALKEPFLYLKKGSQAYAFISQDSQYVLKLFKRHHMQDAKWLENIPCCGVLEKWKNILLQKRRRKLDLAKNSYFLATTKLKKECGILAFQLHASNNAPLLVRLEDGIKRTHIVDITQCGYVLQKKASLVYPSFNRWIAQKDSESCHKAIRSLVSLIASRSKMGIEDVDPDIHKNAGLVGTDALFIDIGSFVDKKAPLSKEAFRTDLKKIFKEFRSFLQKKEPALVPFLDQTMDSAIAHYEH